MAEVKEGLVVVDEGRDPEIDTDNVDCCWSIMFYFQLY